ncbi:hypothetical protein TMEN_5604 [Trichophyton mentagrophytes]|nr:hypothetical protein TMEN_5604 [Trichophyton mentagrophytes]
MATTTTIICAGLNAPSAGEAACPLEARPPSQPITGSDAMVGRAVYGTFPNSDLHLPMALYTECLDAKPRGTPEGKPILISGKFALVDIIPRTWIGESP